jgi:hypothetical protein
MLMQCQHLFDYLGVRLVAIGNGAVKHAAQFKNEFKMAFEVYTDPDQHVYNDLQTKRGWTRVILNRKGLASFIKATKEGYSQKEVLGDGARNGGMFLFKRTQLVYRHIESYAGDYPEMSTVLTACGGADIVGQIEILTPKDEKKRLKEQQKKRAEENRDTAWQIVDLNDD